MHDPALSHCNDFYGSSLNGVRDVSVDEPVSRLLVVILIEAAKSGTIDAPVPSLRLNDQS